MNAARPAGQDDQPERGGHRRDEAPPASGSADELGRSASEAHDRDRGTGRCEQPDTVVEAGGKRDVLRFRGDEDRVGSERADGPAGAELPGIS